MRKNLEIPQGKRTKGYRFLEMLPGLISYGAIILLFLLSWLDPVIGSIYLFILISTTLVKAIGIAYRTVQGYNVIKRAERVDWRRRMEDLENPHEAYERLHDDDNKSYHFENHIENLKMNTAIAAFMTFINVIKKDKFITKEELRIFLILLNPLAPHITSEMYEMIFGGNIIDDEWPKYNEKYLSRNEINLPIQINGKMKKTILVDSNIEDENEIIKMIRSEYPDLIKNDIKKVIYQR